MTHSHDFETWPFTDPTNTTAYTTVLVLKKQHPILLVTHDEDGDWQVLCGTTNSSDDGRVACLGCLFLLDPTIGVLADLPPGWRAWRETVADSWHREAKFTPCSPELWDEFIVTAIDYLSARQDALRSDFKLDHWQEYFYDQEQGTLTFSSNGHVGLIADMKVVGSISISGGTWLWSWENQSILEQVKHRMEDVREYGEAHGFEKLVNAEWPGDDRDGWEMTAAAAYILKAEGAYRAPNENGALFMILRNVLRPA